MPDDIRVLIVDDDDIVRAALELYLHSHATLSVVGTADNGVEAVDKARLLTPDVILMDLFMPQKSGIEATQEITLANPDIRVVVLTAVAESSQAERAMAAGACGFIPKGASPQELFEAIHLAHNGDSYIHPTVSMTRDERHPVSPPTLLTDREREILKLLAQGLSNQDVATHLQLSPRTVGNHVSSILDKLKLDNRTQAVIYAFKRGIVSLPAISIGLHLVGKLPF